MTRLVSLNRAYKGDYNDVEILMTECCLGWVRFELKVAG
jgi:hypothetical protein